MSLKLRKLDTIRSNFSEEKSKEANASQAVLIQSAKGKKRPLSAEMLPKDVVVSEKEISSLSPRSSVLIQDFYSDSEPSCYSDFKNVTPVV